MRPTRKLVLSSLSLAAGAALVVPLPAHANRTAQTVWLETSQAAGVARQAQGHWQWTDFVYDDGARGDNAADIVSTDVTTDGGDLVVAITLNTMRKTDDPVLGIALAEPGRGTAQPWPGKSGVESTWQAFVTADRRTASLTAGGRTRRLAAPHVDAGEHVLQVRVPGWGDRHRLRLDIGAGVQQRGAWASPGVLDLAFNSAAAEPIYDKDNYRNHAQQDALDRGDVDAFAVDLDLDSLRAKTTVRSSWTPGTQVRVYRTVQDLGGGYGASYPRMLGLYQPYTLYIPPGYDPDRPTCLTLLMHSLNNTNNEYVATSVYPTIAGDRGCLAVTPLAKGVDGWYWDEALVDTLQVLDDVEHLVPVDRDQVTLTGYSMGGYGTYRLATLLPSLFAAGSMWAGVPAYYIWPYPAPPISTPSRQSPGMAYDQLVNTQHVPLFIAQGTHDELVPVSGPTAMARRLDDLGYTYRYDLYAGFDHFSFTYIDKWQAWRDWLGHRQRMTSPAEVSFAVRPQSWVDSARSAADQKRMLTLLGHLAADLGGALDSDYWVHDVRPGGTGDVTATVHLTSGAQAARVPQAHPVRDATPGPPYVIGFTVQAGPPFGHVLTGNDNTWGAAPVSNSLTGTLTNTTSLTVDLAAAGLHLEGLALHVTTDTRCTLRLVDGPGRSRTVTLQPGAAA